MKFSNKKASRLRITFDIILGGLILSAVGAGAVILPFHLGKMYDSAISNTIIKGRNVVFLQNEFIKTPLAVENENGDFNIKRTPSEIFRTDLYKKREKDILKLDIELYDIIFKKQNVK